MRIGVLVLGGLLLAAEPGIAGEMYQWTDANGKKHFTDHPPPAGVSATRSTLQPLPTTTKAQPAPEEEEYDPKRAEAERYQQYKADRLADRKRAAEEARRQEHRDRVRAEQAEAARWRQEQAEREKKDAKCERLKDLADKASGFKGRWENECG